MPEQQLRKSSARIPITLGLGATLIASALLSLSAAVAQPQSKPPRVLATIAPIHSLAAAVMKGVGVPELLVEGTFSEHTYTLKPSDARKLNEAQIIVRVAPNLETFLNKSLESLPKAARVINLVTAPGMVLWPVRVGGDFEPHDHFKLNEHKEGRGHDHGNGEHGGHEHATPDEFPDPHIWLDPRNAARIADAISASLIELDPAHTERYKNNTETLKARLAALDASLSAELSSLRNKPYVVFHDAYQYFEKRYGLNPVGSISLSSAQPPGAGHMKKLRQKIQNLKAVCVFTEPQFDARLANALIEGTNAKTAVLDGIGANLATGPELYFDLERQLAQSLKSCVAGK
jgi:zinc transport system substrate-binding protein